MKRSHGTGSITKTRNARYIARMTDPRTGERRSLGTFRTRREAEVAVAEGLVQGVPKQAARQNLGTYLEDYLEAHRAYVKQTTSSADRMNVRRYVLPYSIARIALDQLVPADFRRLYTQLAEGGKRDGSPLAESSISRVNRLLKTALRQAVEDGILRSSPVPRRSRRIEEREAKWLTLEQCHRLAAFAATERVDLEVLVRMASFAGLRRGEILGLRWGDVDLVAAEARIRRNRTVADGVPVESTPKTKASATVVPLDAQLVLPALVVALERRERVREAEGIEVPIDEEYVVCGRDGGGRDPNNVARDFRVLFDRFNARRYDGRLPAVSIHGLRHSFASNLRAAGEDVHTVSRAARHASIVTTADVYVHGADAGVRKAVESLRSATA